MVLPCYLWSSWCLKMFPGLDSGQYNWPTESQGRNYHHSDCLCYRLDCLLWTSAVHTWITRANGWDFGPSGDVSFFFCFQLPSRIFPTPYRLRKWNQRCFFFHRDSVLKMWSLAVHCAGRFSAHVNLHRRKTPSQSSLRSSVSSPSVLSLIYSVMPDKKAPSVNTHPFCPASVRQGSELSSAWKCKYSDCKLVCTRLLFSCRKTNSFGSCHHAAPDSPRRFRVLLFFCFIFLVIHGRFPEIGSLSFSGPLASTPCWKSRLWFPWTCASC